MLVVLVGPSGSGKTSVWEGLIREHGCMPFQTVTTRPRREEEQGKEWVQYQFVSQDVFAEWESQGAFMESIMYVGNRYGTLRREVERAIASSKVYVGIVEQEGSDRLKLFHPQVCSIFIRPSDQEALKQRLKERDSETMESFLSRISLIESEMLHESSNDFTVINDVLSESIGHAGRIISDLRHVNRLAIEQEG